MAKANQPDQQAERELCVLKFGSSVLAGEVDYAAVAGEVYRHVRDGETVIAVVSALAGETDALLAQAEAVGGEAPGELVARLARVGELRSAALTALALSRVGVRARVLDPDEMGLYAQGDPLDSDLCALDADRVAEAVDGAEAVVVPGFCAKHAEHGVATLGRGGTDLTAVFFAAKVGARRVRLIKDVDGVYAEDPAKNPKAERFAELDYVEAAKASAGLIQPKAIDMARDTGVVIEVASLGAGEATRIAAKPARKSPTRPVQPLRVALLGCGAVGAGALAMLKSRPDLFEMNPVLVRDPAKHEASGLGAVFTDKLERALSGGPDLVIEAIGGADYPADIIESALNAGAHVVTANKAAVAKHYARLHAASERSGAMFAFSASVGGGAPVIEAVRRLRERSGLAAVEGVMNGTGNFILSKLGEGWAFEDAVKTAQEMGFAEADPSADVDGHDAADKLSILIREAFGADVAPQEIAKDSLSVASPESAREALQRGEVFKQVGRCVLKEDGSVEASVVVAPVKQGGALSRTRNEENAFLVTEASGRVHAIHGKGAGRWPTAAAVFADVMDVQRAAAAVGLAKALAEESAQPALKRA